MFPRCSLLLNRMGGLSTVWDPTINVVSFQCVRWRKKRTDPKAKSKLDYKRIPTPIDPWEYEFLTTKTPHYRTILRAMRKMFKEEQAQKSTETAEGGSAEERAQMERQEHLSLLEWNEQENARTRAIREERLHLELREKEEKKLGKMLEMEEERRRTLEELAIRVRQEKEASKSYITMDNVEQAIENALADSKEYNFTIDKRGRILLPENSAWQELKARQELTVDDGEENIEEQKQQQ
ncbi:28S ribosomal protein S26, mitochondrial-like [Patiria miniata]|uniref:Small ribosomal subunit protein mS26 n=1 Tax=Patiria miniata TaxID=46514 RepID=A0A914B4W1_PATMI|nr:28S ribosomal protein S26, mitochondrial-like [Patiria miniata]XP_038070527.1 28S ribosomal protein S26, mitochondrial-like [Patiria miniata]XP_038070528.1 28S ribosomal protein S26, mitochondrial-like [Patiria miniata]